MALFNLFPKKKKKSGRTTHSAYYLRENMIQNVSDLLMAVQPNLDECPSKWESKMALLFNAIEFKNITPEIVTQQMGEPVFIHDNSQSVEGHQVIFYRDEVDYFRFLVQIHFINNQFVFISSKISTSGVLSEENKTKIAKKVLSKFFEANEIEKLDSFTICITDESKNVIYTKDDVYFYVNYVYAGTHLQKIVTHFEGLSGLNTGKTDFTDTLDKYI